MHGESARYARIAKASLTESQNHSWMALHRKHWNFADVEPPTLLSKRAIAATVGWIAYLKGPKRLQLIGDC